MNERIYALAAQAGLESKIMLDDSSRDVECFVTQYNGSIPSIDNYEKFYKLIVADIMITVAAHALSNDSAMDVYSNLSHIYEGAQRPELPPELNGQVDLDF